MFDLIEIELTRVRRMAEHSSDDLLLYLIDMAIIQANAKARSADRRSEATSAPAPPDLRFAMNAARELQIVR